MSRLAGDMKGFVVLGVYRSTVKKNRTRKKTLLWLTHFIVILLLSEGRASTIWKTLQKMMHYEMSEAMGRKIL